MAKDIEEFLRRAAERRRQQQSGQQPAPTPSSPRRSSVSRPRAVTPTPYEEPLIIDDVEIVEAETNLRRQSVEEHVRSHLDTTDISRHAESLGDRIESASARIESRVKQHLDHDLSKLDNRPTVTDDPAPKIVGKEVSSLAIALRKQLKNPKSIGQAIILAEILKRPDFD